TDPPRKFMRVAAPGEAAAEGAVDDADAMLRMINAARASEHLSALVRDTKLDALAKVHSEEMIKVKIVGHDVGTGDPAARVKATGYPAHVVGENVASASSTPNAHRALWASPSHRGNILLDRFKKVGLGVAKDGEGLFWVTELFVD